MISELKRDNNSRRCDIDLLRDVVWRQIDSDGCGWTITCYRLGNGDLWLALARCPAEHDWCVVIDSHVLTAIMEGDTLIWNLALTRRTPENEELFRKTVHADGSSTICGVRFPFRPFVA